MSIESELSSRKRHERDCKVCHHSQRMKIEREWITWGDTTLIAKQHRLTRDSIYRHAHANGLFAKRRRNIRHALERIIEKAGAVPVTAPAVVAAIHTYSKINAQGEWVENTEHIDLNGLFNRMRSDELMAYAKEGKLPAWFEEAAGATRPESEAETKSG